MQLRPHQNTALDQARASIRQGLLRPLIAAPTGFGKTVLAGQMMESCYKAGKRGWFFCDRIKLVNQTVSKFIDFEMEFAVKQADHPLEDPYAPIQVVSIQTYDAVVKANNNELHLAPDLIIVDECSTQYDIIKRVIEHLPNTPIIGLDATPYTKGLGKLYNNLIVPITHRELEAQGYLCPINYCVGEHIDLTKIRSMDANTYSAQDLEKATGESKEVLTGCIIKNWLEFGENSQTIAFSPSMDHSKYLVQKFNDMGISAVHIDCYTDPDERETIYEAHNKGEFKILACSRLLGVGYDSPTTRCLIDCYPVKSRKTYVQRAGRIARTSDGKEYAIYLDHAGNYEQFGGPAEDIVPTELHDGESPHREQDLTNQKKEKPEPKKSECPKCYSEMIGRGCACGYEIPTTQTMEDDGTMLVMVGNELNKKTPLAEKQQFLASMMKHGKDKKYKDGYAACQYKEKFGLWPNGIEVVPASEMCKMSKGWIKHQNIKKAKTRQAAKKAVSNINQALS